MPREVIIENTTFIVNSYSSEDATENMDEIMKRVIVSNAEMEFKNRPITGNFESNDPQNLHYD